MQNENVNGYHILSGALLAFRRVSRYCDTHARRGESFATALGAAVLVLLSSKVLGGAVIGSLARKQLVLGRHAGRSARVHGTERKHGYASAASVRSTLAARLPTREAVPRLSKHCALGLTLCV